MIIDAHTHAIGSDISGSVRSLLEAMDHAEIAHAALFPSPFGHCSTDEVLAQVRQHPDRLIPVGSASPNDEPATRDRLYGYIRDGKVRAVKFFSGYEPFSAADVPRISPVLDVLAECKTPAIFHTGDTLAGMPGARLKFARPLDVDEAAVAYPNLPIIIAHLGNPWMMDAAAVIYKNPNVYADISGWVYGKFEEDDRTALSAKLMEVRSYLGSLERLLFGTDYPISNPADYVAFVRALPISGTEHAAIFSGNARTLFRLDE